MKCAKCGTKIEPFNNKGGTCGADNCMTKTSPTKTIKEELKREYFNWHYERRDQNLVPVDIAYWWLDKLDSILEAERAQVREGIYVLRKENKRTTKWSDDYYHALTDCLSLLEPNKEPNGQEEL